MSAIDTSKVFVTFLGFQKLVGPDLGMFMVLESITIKYNGWENKHHFENFPEGKQSKEIDVFDCPRR